jgi:hypothetical protein
LVTPSADLSLVGTRIVGSHTVGVHARDNAVSTRLVGTSIERTEVDATYGWLGAGAWFKEVDGVQVLASRFDRNRAAGLILDTTTATIEGTMVLETLQAKFAAPDAKEGDTPFEMADGVLLRLGSGVTVLRSLVFQQPRAGLLAHASPKVVVQKTFVSDCGFGLALIETDGVQVKGNLLHGNDQNLATDSLPVPPAPDLADL